MRGNSFIPASARRPGRVVIALAAALFLAFPALAQHEGHGQEAKPAPPAASKAAPAQTPATQAPAGPAKAASGADHSGHGAPAAPAGKPAPAGSPSQPPQAKSQPAPQPSPPPAPTASPAPTSRPAPGTASQPAAQPAPGVPSKTQAGAAGDHSGHGQPAPAGTALQQPAPGQPAPPQPAPAPAAPAVTITPEQARLIGVATSTAAVRPFRKVIRATGRIEVDERKIVMVNTKVEGFVERLNADHVGMVVRKGEPLLSLYSPEVYAIQLEYLNLLAWQKASKASNAASSATASNAASSGEPGAAEFSRMLESDSMALLSAARTRLSLLDAGGLAAQLEKTGRPSRSFGVSSPVTGYVMKRMATLGMRVMPGEPLYELADLSTVWVLGEVYEQDLPFVREGQQASIALTGVAGPSLRARVEHIYPVLAGDTRTARIRFSLPNPRGELRPEMYAEIQMDADLGNRLAVPDSAVIDTGERQIVYVDEGRGRFSLREVRAGVRSGGLIEIVSGLKSGEAVASSANFLIDAETRLKGSGGASGHQH